MAHRLRLSASEGTDALNRVSYYIESKTANRLLVPPLNQFISIIFADRVVQVGDEVLVESLIVEN